MIVRIIDVYVKQTEVEKFKDATVKNRGGSINEPGILRFDVLQDSSDSTHFVLYEVYRSEAATMDHKETSHYGEWKAAVEPMMARNRESVACDPIAPIDEDQWAAR